MGANQSTRKITVVNDEASGVIKISDAVVQRLKGEITGESAAPPSPVASSPPPPVEAPTTATPLPPPPPPQDVAPPPPPSDHPTVEATATHVWQRPIIQYIEEPSLSALRVRTEKEEELMQLEAYWQERLASQETAHIEQAKLTEEEVARSARMVDTLFRPVSSHRKELCRDASDAVQSCYSSNSQQPLLCRDKVLQFSHCVHQARANLLTPSG